MLRATCVIIFKLLTMSYLSDFISFGQASDERSLGNIPQFRRRWLGNTPRLRSGLANASTVCEGLNLRISIFSGHHS